jgi:hypothetical protein
MYYHQPLFPVMTHNMVQTINILLSVGGGKILRGTSAPTSAVYSFVSERADPSTMS